VIAIVGQSLFSITWLVAGGIDGRYSDERQYVSELAARDAAHPWIVTVGIAALGVSFVALGLGLRAALPPRRWSRLGPMLFVAAGLGIALIALLPLDCAPSVDRACEARLKEWELSWRHYGHDIVGVAVQLSLAATPFALALALRPGPLARAAVLLGAIGLSLGVAHIAAISVDEDRAGIYQRAGLVALHGWACLLAVALLVPRVAENGSRAR
jgi:hypothetical protein